MVTAGFLGCEGPHQQRHCRDGPWLGAASDAEPAWLASQGWSACLGSGPTSWLMPLPSAGTVAPMAWE